MLNRAATAELCETALLNNRWHH